MKIGFIGLGAMGAGIARNLLKAGHQVTGWNRSEAPCAAFARDGGTVAATMPEALQGEMVFTMLANDAAFEETGFTGPLLADAAPGLVHVNMATISLPMARTLTEAHAKAKLGYIACPVFGRPDAAASAKLQLVAAGDPALIERAKPVLASVGMTLVVAGDRPEQANLFKLAGNFMTAVSIETYGEAIALLRKGGVDPAGFYELMSGLYYSGAIHSLYGKMIVEEAYEPAGFKLRHGCKDAGLVREAAKLYEVPLPLAALVHDHFLEEMAAGNADKDWSLIAKKAAQRAGLK